VTRRSASEDAAGVPIRAVWVAAADAAGSLRMATFPAAHGPGAAFLVCNRPDALRDLLGDSEAGRSLSVLDFSALFRLACPAAAAETVGEMLAYLAAAPPAASPERDPEAGARVLWAAWEGLCARLRRLPAGLLRTLAGVHRDLGEPEAGLFLRLAQDAGGETEPTGWIQRLPSSAGPGAAGRRPLLAVADCSAVDAAAAARELSAGGGLARLVPGYEPRQGQLDMVRAVTEAFNSGRHLVVEAGTGIGKSLAYLLPAALWARLNDVPVVVSTNTRNLQTQLIEKDLPLVERLLSASGGKRPLRTALIKGRSNYLCLRRLRFLLENGADGIERPRRRQFARLLCWAAQTASGDLDELAGGSEVEAPFLSQFGSLGEECAGRACRHARRCFLQRARERSLQADVIVANHALVFAEMSTPGVALPPHNQIVFDEAHNIEEAATRHYSIEISPGRLALLLRRLAAGRGRRPTGVLEVLRRRLDQGVLAGDAARRRHWHEALEAAREGVAAVHHAGRQLFAAFRDLLPADGSARRFGMQAAAPSGTAVPSGADAALWEEARQRASELRGCAQTAAACLTKLAEILRGELSGQLPLLADETADLDGAAQFLAAFGLDLDFVLAGADAAHVCWLQRARTREPLGEAWAAPLEIGPLLAAGLYGAKASVVFCSATLRVGTSFDFLAGRLGIDRLPAERVSFCVAPSPFDYPRQCVVFVPSYLPEPGDPDRSFVTELSAALAGVTAATRGRSLVLFTSIETMETCARTVAGRLEAAGLRLLVQGQSGSRDQITRLFRQGGGCVLFGVHSFWEGVDVVGDALICLVMARLPFAAVADPVFEARCERIERSGGRPFTAFVLPHAVIRFRQGFGRLIRHREDRGVVVVADTRILARQYGAWFQRSLPCRIAACETPQALLEAVSAFLRDT
jgi:Rad3-related DNA helicase